MADPAPVCPACKRAVPANSESKPFCSDRCRRVDLGRWFHEDFVVSRPLRPDDPVPEEE